MKRIFALVLAFTLVFASVFSTGCGGSTAEPCAHSFIAETVVEATCYTEGTVKNTCSKCGTSTYNAVAILAHDYVDGACSRCNKAENDQPLDQTCEHQFTESVLEQATCAKGGAIKRTCIECGYSYSQLTEKTTHVFINGVCSTCNGLERDEANPCQHVYITSVAKEATCYSEGVLVNTCSVCSSFFLSTIEKTAHQYNGEGVCTECEAREQNDTSCEHDYVQSIINATCTASGSILQICSSCGDRVEIIVDILPHRYLNGACTVCGALESQQTTPCEHDYFITDLNATCVAEGSIVKICTICNSVETQILPLVAHDFVEGECSVCHTTQGNSSTEPTPCVHEFHPSLIREATCLEEGLIADVCAYCSHTVYTTINKTAHLYANGLCVKCNQPESAHGTPCAHEYDEQRYESSCAENGLIINTCSICHSVVTEIINKLPHSFGNAILTKTATCFEEGQSVQICSDCGQAKITYIEKIAHSYSEGYCLTCGQPESSLPCVHQYSSEVISEATCLEEGSVKKTCLNCGDEKTESIAKLNHLFVNGKCALCEVLESALPDSCEHIYLAEIEDATCTQTGLIKKTCTKCNSIVTITVAKLSHTYSTTTVQPTCEAQGSITMTCSDCGHQIVTITEKLPHVYVGGVCSNCGHADLSSQHQYVSEVIRENTCEIYGVVINTCTICGDVNISTEQKLTHNFVDGVCSLCGKLDTTSSIVVNTQITLNDIKDTLYAYDGKITNEAKALAVLSNTTINNVYVKNNALLFDFNYDDFTITASQKINKSLTQTVAGVSDMILTVEVVKNSSNYQLNVIYADGTSENAGALTDNGGKFISYLQVNDSNELIVNYSDNTAQKFGKLNPAPLNISAGLLKYSKIEGKEEYKVVGCIDKKATTIVVPKTHKGLPVTYIDEYAFAFSKAESVQISENVRTIATWAFYNASELMVVRLPKTVTTINNSAFLGCLKIVRVYYRGSEIQKDNISIGTGNESLVNALWICNAD